MVHKPSLLITKTLDREITLVQKYPNECSGFAWKITLINRVVELAECNRVSCACSGLQPATLPCCRHVFPEYSGKSWKSLWKVWANVELLIHRIKLVWTLKEWREKFRRDFRKSHQIFVLLEAIYENWVYTVTPKTWFYELRTYLIYFINKQHIFKAVSQLITIQKYTTNFCNM